ncbi:MAG: rod shape-determining protein MreC [Bacteroidetes bacterium]|nr:rod shape-determining protein MreC [Bacteroidota bacterium]MCH8523693.1 rod shape-determining protein MreC [Balneolales bacterium]
MPFLLSKIENARDHILTGVLLIIAITLLVTRHDGGLQNTRIIAMTAMSYMERPLSSARVYRTALQTNRELHEENVRLRDELSRLRSANEEIFQLRELLNFRYANQDTHPLIPVQIVGKNLTGLRNMITVDRGREDEIEIGMPLVNSNGLIGQVVIVGRNHAQVMPIQNNLFRASARIQGSRSYGMISWSGSGNTLILNYVPQTVIVEAGMVIETSGLSNTFPANIPIGTITKSEPEPGRDTQVIYVEPFVNLSNVAEGFIVQYIPPAEIDSLVQVYEVQF